MGNVNKPEDFFSGEFAERKGLVCGIFTVLVVLLYGGSRRCAGAAWYPTNTVKNLYSAGLYSGRRILAKHF